MHSVLTRISAKAANCAAKLAEGGLPHNMTGNRPCQSWRETIRERRNSGDSSVRYIGPMPCAKLVWRSGMVVGSRCCENEAMSCLGKSI